MEFVEGLDSFELYNHLVLNEKINFVVLFEPVAFVVEWKWVFRFNSNSTDLEFERHTFLVG